MRREKKPVLSDLSKITADMMGPGQCDEYDIYVDPHITPDFVKSTKDRYVPDVPIIYEIGDHTYQVNEFGMASFYVLVGEERGLVIDCGCGSIDVKEIVGHLCTLPYDVAITHAHGDHCGAMCQFDKVWMYPQDIPLVHDSFRINQQCWENPNIWRSFPPTYPSGETIEFKAANSGSKALYDFTNLTFDGIDEDHLPQILELTEGQVFHLGGRDVTVIRMQGHTEGSAVFIDPKTRIAFVGDALNEDFNIMGNPPELNVELLKKFRSYRKDFDRMYPGHTAIACCTANFSQSPAKLDDAICAYQSVADGTAVIEEENVHGHMMKKAVYGTAKVDIGGKPPAAG